MYPNKTTFQKVVSGQTKGSKHCFDNIFYV